MAEKGDLCLQCNRNLKHWKSKVCQECYFTNKREKNPNSKWNTHSYPSKQRIPCERCNGKNTKSCNATMCISCRKEERRKNREGEQQCIYCHVVLTDGNWPEHRKKWWHRICEDCWRAKQKPQEARNSDSIEYRKRIKFEVMTAYGGKCHCCGESEIAFLTLDHVQNDGKSHLHKNGKHRLGGDSLYRWAKKNGYPDSLQCLCMNCNFAKSKNPGGCPHQMNREAKEAVV